MGVKNARKLLPPAAEELRPTRLLVERAAHAFESIVEDVFTSSIFKWLTLLGLTNLNGYYSHRVAPPFGALISLVRH